MASFVSGGVVADEATIRSGGHHKIGPAPIGRSADEVAPSGLPGPSALQLLFGRPIAGKGRVGAESIRRHSTSVCVFRGEQVSVPVGKFLIGAQLTA